MTMQIRATLFLLNPAMRTLAAIGLGAAIAAGMSGCHGERNDSPPRQLLPDMDDSPKFKPQTKSEFFADGRTMRPHVPGTVAFGTSSRVDDPSRADFRRDSVAFYEGIDAAAKPVKQVDGTMGPVYLAQMPIEALENFIAHQAGKGINYAGDPGQARADAMKAMIMRGKERFNIYCSACHGFKAEGGDPAKGTGGIVGRKWGYPVPSLQDAKYRDRDVFTGRDGYIFHVIRYGVKGANEDTPNKMPSYADKVNERDAWAIVAYVRTLQAAWQEGTATASATSSQGRTDGGQP